MNEMSRREVKVLFAFILLQPILALGHELLVVLVAAFVSAVVNSDLFYQFVSQFLGSSVHATIMVETLGGVRTEGIAVVGWPGEFLQHVFPALFVDPSATAAPAWISAIIDKDSTVLGFFITQAIVEFLVIAFGLLVLRFGIKNRSIWNVLKDAPVRQVVSIAIGMFMVAQAIGSALRLTLSPALAGLRETGIGVGFSLLLQMDKPQYDWLMDQLLPILIPIILIGTAIGTGWLAGKFFDRIQAALGKPSPIGNSSITTRAIRKAHLALALAPLLAVSAISPRYFGLENTSLVVLAPQVSPNPSAQSTEYAVSAPSTPIPVLPLLLPTPTLSVVVTTPITQSNQIAGVSPAAANAPTLVASPILVPTQTRPSRVELKRDGNRFSLAVNNRPTYVTGLNYNVNYTAFPDEVKRNLHQRDFQIMRNAGVNAVIGWGVYDRVTLEVANNFGIGIIMPFDLDAKGAYWNKSYRDQIKNEFRKFVNTYKDAPAVWGWNPGGDELLQRMETEQHRTADKIQNAADFLLELSTLAYSLDSNHVSIIKEPRNCYVPYFEDAIRRARKLQPASDPASTLFSDQTSMEDRRALRRF
jgi:hypothetical protein